MNDEEKDLLEYIVNELDELSLRIETIRSQVKAKLDEDNESPLAFPSLNAMEENRDEGADSEEELKPKKLSAMDLLELSPLLRTVMVDVMKRPGRTDKAIADAVGRPLDEIKEVLTVLMQKGYVETVEKDGSEVFTPALERKKGARIPMNIWDALEKKL